MGFWNPERDTQLADLWVSGSTMKEIAAAVGAVSRCAVAGRLTRLGLVGKGGCAPGSKVGQNAEQRREADRPYHDAVERAFQIAHGGPPDRTLAEHRAALVLLAAVAASRSPHFAARYARVGLAEATSVLLEADRTGIWPVDCGAPLDRWTLPGRIQDDALLCLDIICI